MTLLGLCVFCEPERQAPGHKSVSEGFLEQCGSHCGEEEEGKAAVGRFYLHPQPTIPPIVPKDARAHPMQTNAWCFWS